MAQANTDFGVVADDLRRAASAFALLTSSATAFGSSLQQFRDFERQLVLTNAIAGGTVAQFNAMKEASREFALTTTTSATDAAASLQQLAQAGFTAEESLSAMAGVLLLAQATLTDVGVTADILSSNIRAFGLQASDASRVSNVFAASVTSSLATMDKLSFAFRQVAPVAKLANLSIEETTALLNQLFNVGLRGEQAGTALRNIIIRLVRPLGEAKDILRDAGVATRDATGALRPLVDIFDDLRDANLDNADLARIFETEALAGVVTLLKATEEGIDGLGSAYARNLEQITGTNKALELAAANLDTFDGQMRIFRNTINDVQKDIGEALVPVIEAVTDTIISWIEAFRALDPETQKIIAGVAGAATAVGILLAAANALSLLLIGPFTRGVASGAAGLLGVGKAADGTQRSLTLLGRGLQSIAGAVRALPALFLSLFSVMRGATLAAAFIVPGGPIIAGLALIATALATGVGAWKLWGDAAERAGNRARKSLEFELGLEQGQSSLESVLPENDILELEKKAERLADVLKLAQLQGPQDTARDSAIAESDAKALREVYEQEQQELREAFSSIEGVILERERLNAKIDQVNRLEAAGALDANAASFARANIAKFRDNYLANIDAGLQAQLEVFDAANERLREGRDALTALATEASNIERDNLTGFIDDLASGRASLEGDYANLTERVREALSSTEVRKAVVAALDQANVSDDYNIILESLRAAGVDPVIIADFINSQQKQRISNIANNLRAAQADIAASTEEIRIALLEQQADTATSVAEAVQASTEAGLANLILDLEDLTAENASLLQDAMADFALDSRDGYRDAVTAAFAGSGYEDLFDGVPGFEELMSGTVLIDAIAEQIDSSTTVEEAEAIIAAEFAKYQAIVQAFLESIKAAGIVTEGELAAIEGTFAALAENAAAAALNGLGSVVASVEGVRKSTASRIKRASGGGGRKSGGGGKSAEQQAKEALRDARKLEDAFRDASDQMLKARLTFLENAAGLDVNARISATLELDVAQIEADADKQIERLKRKLEDLKLDGADGAQVAQLEAQYNQLIEQIERTKQAEIDAATSFEAQMKRRSEAIDLYIRDLKTLAFESDSTFTQVAAGVQIAFAEFNKEIVTLTDITTDAVTGYLDAITTGIGDFIFDNENAMENFKANMLKISRQVFEGFTKSLLQQAVSSLTGGGGSLFGNSAQPGPGGSEQPGVGNGGIFGKIFGGLFGGNKGGSGAGGGTTPQGAGSGTAGAVANALGIGGGQGGAGQLDMTAIQQAIDAFGQQLQQTFQQFVQETVNTLNQFGNEFAGALNEVTQAIRQMGQQVAASAGGGGISFNPISAGGTGGGGFGGGGGGFNPLSFVSSLFSFFSQGGPVFGAGTATSDSIPSFLSAGEYVIRASETTKHRKLLDAINAGRISQEEGNRLLQRATGSGGGGGGGLGGAFSGGFASILNDKIGFGGFLGLAKGKGVGGFLGFANGGLVGDAFTPSLNSPMPRPIMVPLGSRSGGNSAPGSISRTQNVNINISNSFTGQQSESGVRRTANQQAKAIANVIERSKRDT